MSELKDNAELLSYQRPYDMSAKIQKIIVDLVSAVYSSVSNVDTKLRLAALFDLLVSCLYYDRIANRGWTYCNESHNMLIYPYTNICPHCLSKGKFVHTIANKPESGQIGVATTEILCEMLMAAFSYRKHKVEILKASEPIDVILHDPATGMMIIAEVKAAPLFTLPLGAYCNQQTDIIDGEIVPVPHGLMDNASWSQSDLFIYFPKTRELPERSFPLHIKGKDEFAFFEAICTLTDTDPKFLKHYFSFWQEAFIAYRDKDREDPIFWLTNACGQPTPRPDNWPRRRGSGYESVSDAKTSVGMDRTDDIKKGIYQVLKLGAEYKPKYKGIKTALISNVHAVRHHDEYLKCIQDIIWTIDKTRAVTSWNSLPADYPLYNLFDGIISFTESDIRDADVKNLFAVL